LNKTGNGYKTLEHRAKRAFWVDLNKNVTLYASSIKLLIFARNYTNFVSRNGMYYLLAELAKITLDHEEERLEIAERGYEMVRARHSTAKRVAELFAVIENIIQS